MKIFKYIICAILLLGSISCDKWLDIRPEDEIGEYDLIKDEKGAYRALNGIYGQLVKGELYGAELLCGLTEILAQQYTISSDVNNQHVYIDRADYKYDEDGVKYTIDEVWKKAYYVIANINNLLQKMVLIKDQFSDIKEYETMRGELYGVRAFLHFDMLRLFGPMVYELNKTDKAIPYYTRLVDSPEPILTAEEVVAKIEHDMAIAMQLLVNDPVLMGGYNYYRKYNMNYAAVRALRARVSLYKGDKQMAYQYASALLGTVDGSSGIIDEVFPWVSAGRATSVDFPDRMFTSEVVFAITAANREENIHDSYFNEKIISENILGIGDGVYAELFPSSTLPDYRKMSWEKINSKMITRGFMKFEEFDSDNVDIIESSTIIPLIRKSEVLLIMIECASSESEKQRLIDLLAQKRGAAAGAIGNQPNVEEYLQNEYRKEFFGEGQYFYFLKRKGVERIYRWQSKDAKIPVEMDKSKYVLPLPDSEIEYRD